MSGWIGVDFDGTLAEYGTWQGPTHVGKPVGEMLFRVRKWLADGREVRIFTARAFPLGCIEPEHGLPLPAANGAVLATREQVAAEAVHAIRAWCQEHLGQVLAVTCIKDYGMVELYDDRAVQVEMNTGRLIGQSTRGLT